MSKKLKTICIWTTQLNSIRMCKQMIVEQSTKVQADSNRLCDATTVE